MKVYLDDERPTPNGWVGVKTAREAIELLKTGDVEVISLDHDLGPDPQTGYDVAKWIEQAAHNGELGPIRMRCHSASTVGKQNINAALRSAMRFWYPMSKDTKKRLCQGCRDNFYNQPGNSTTGECWMLADSKPVERTKVGVWQNPPYKWEPQTTLSCHHPEGSVWIKQDDVRIK